MPDRYAALAESLESAAQARAAYVEALREVERQIQGVEAARLDAGRAGAGKPQAAAPELYALVDAVAPGPDLTSDMLHGRHSVGTLASALGIERQQALAS